MASRLPILLASTLVCLSRASWISVDVESTRDKPVSRSRPERSLWVGTHRDSLPIDANSTSSPAIAQ